MGFAQEEAHEHQEVLRGPTIIHQDLRCNYRCLNKGPLTLQATVSWGPAGEEIEVRGGLALLDGAEDHWNHEVPQLSRFCLPL